MGRLEARTEDLFGDLLRKTGYTSENGVTVDRQSCRIKEIDDCFAHASKTEGSDRAGYPDFIITNNIYPGIVILAECKADNSNHGQAAQEVLGYAGYLKGKYDVVVVAVSGTTETNFKIDTAIIRKDGSGVSYKTTGYDGSTILPLADYEHWIGYTKRAEQAVIAELNLIKDDINWVLYAAGNLNSDKRMLIISACLLGLRDSAFRGSFQTYQDTDILDVLLSSVERVLKKYGIPDVKRNTMMANFDTLKQLEVLSSRVEYKRERARL